jgi:hypothetical protein
MKLNRSLAISSHIQECKAGNIVGLLEAEFPSSLFDQEENEPGRDRVFTVRNTLLTMVLTAIQQDKTLANSVDLYYTIHQQHRQQVMRELELEAAKRQELDKTQYVKRAGRPKKYRVKLPKSLNQDISLNTAAYSKARDRVPVKLTQDLFDASRINDSVNNYTHWHDYRVLIGDGTYVQMQDTPTIRKDYEVKHHDKGSEGYPQGLLEVIIERGTGQLHCFRLDNRHVSELSSFYDMIDQLPSGSLLLLDDLYNCFEIISKCKRKGIELLIPAKRERSYELVEVLASGDEIIRIKTPKNRSKWLEEKEPANKFLMRRICCQSPEGKEYVLHTTILNREINKDEFHMLYLTRWDIEIGIREIKTIMDVNVLRSKTPDMALKELAVSLATYNLLRKIIYASIKNLPFSPQEDFIQKFYTHNKEILIDKTGRIYNRWSTGRKRTTTVDTQNDAPKTKTEQAI